MPLLREVPLHMLAACLTATTSLFPETGTAQTASTKSGDEDRITVNFGIQTGDVHGGAAGSLYGLYDARLPHPNLIEGIALRTVSTKAQDGPQHPGADALEVSTLLTDASGGDTYIYMTDIFREFPYAWKTGDCAKTLDDYMSKLRMQTEQVLELEPRYRQRIVFVPFNEPEANMFSDRAKGCDGKMWLREPATFFGAWDRAVKTIRDILPGARIAGPNTSILYPEVKGFLVHALKAGTLPDIVTWHELSDPATVRASVVRYREWERELFAGTSRAGTQLPININEYAYNYHTSVPGQMIQWISAIEDAKVDADIAYWNIDGNLSDSAVQLARGNGQWWLLNAYSGMTGHTVKVTPPHPDQSYTLQGIASFDPTRRQARVLLGGANGPVTLALAHIPSLIGPEARVLVREIGWSGQLGDSPPPSVVADLTVKVRDGHAELVFGKAGIPLLREESAYEVIVTPAGDQRSAAPISTLWKQDFEAEKARQSGTGLKIRGPEGSPKARSKFYTSGGFSIEGFAAGVNAALHFDVDVPRAGNYDLAVLANTFNRDPKVAAQGATNIFVRVEGDARSERELLLPLGYKPSVWDHSDTKLRLKRGHNVITLATNSLDRLRDTSGNGIVDRITLSLPNPAASQQRYEAQYASLEKGEIRPRDGDVQLATGSSATFWVYFEKDGAARIDLDGAKGPLLVSINGRPAVDSRQAGRTFLHGGINKVVVTASRGASVFRALKIAKEKAGGFQSYEAESARIAGTAKVVKALRASGGKAVSSIGGEPGNANSLTFYIPTKRAGAYALTVRYSNGEQAQATHYNPDPLARVARISVNGAKPFRVTMPNTFHDNNWWEASVVVHLAVGENTVRISGEEQPNWDQKTYASQIWPKTLLRSIFSPNIDRIVITPVE